MRLGLWIVGVLVAVLTPLWVSARIGSRERRARQKTREILARAARDMEHDDEESPATGTGGTALASNEDRS
ncbi:MAG: hypothetical protein IT374_26670 [Polyangiaceae bacterium]|nr:hypothetical protein [Polyangiaceae bacterium]